MKPSRALLLLALRGVPQHLRDSVHGDLLEQQAGTREALALALHFQAEPYRDGASRRGALLLWCAAASVLWAVPLAAHSLLAQAAVFDGALGRAVLWLWSVPNVLAALTCGLWVGRASGLPRHADAVRLHLVLVVTPVAALAAPGALQAALAAGLLPAAAWLAHQNRLASAGRSEPA